MNPLLFVYGTLMAGIESETARFFHENSRFVGEGKMRGYLFDLGHYPGVVFDEQSKGWVTGHVFVLKEPQKMLTLLDSYENVGVRYGKKDEYIRQECPIEMKTGMVDCWVYLYNHSTHGLKIIESGNYLENLDKNLRHREFK